MPLALTSFSVGACWYGTWGWVKAKRRREHGLGHCPRPWTCQRFVKALAHRRIRSACFTFLVPWRRCALCPTGPTKKRSFTSMHGAGSWVFTSSGCVVFFVDLAMALLPGSRTTTAIGLEH